MANQPTSGERSTFSYLKSAFLIPWNVMVFGGACLGAIFSPDPAAFLSLIAAAEGAYLFGLSATPKFRLWADAQAHGGATVVADAPAADWMAMRRELPRADATRFDVLLTRCQQMRGLASAVQGADGRATASVVGELRTSGLDSLLWGFLRLLRHHAALTQLLGQIDKNELSLRKTEIERGLAQAQQSQDERLAKSFQERLATTQARLDYYERTERDAAFLAAELDRVEEKILALSEMAVNQHDANVLSAEIDAAASSMQATESSLASLGLSVGPAIGSAPPGILDGAAALDAAPAVRRPEARNLRTR